MKLVLFISAGAFILFSAFIIRKEKKVQQSLYDSKWSLKKIHTGTGVEEVFSKAFIKFNQAKNSAGGNGGCNSFGSTAVVAGESISIKDIFSTKMYCEGVQPTEDAFFKQLGKVNRFEIKEKMLMLFLDKELLLEFKTE